MTLAQEIFNPTEIKQLLNQGYSMQDIQTSVDEAENNSQDDRLKQSYARASQYRISDPRSGASNSFISGNVDEDLIKWQLELDSILERVEHMLRGDKPTFINGSVIWTPPKDDKEQIFNERGVSEIMRILSNYVNRNTILSNYDEDTINDKMLDLGKEISDLIYLKYEVFGLNDLEKRKLYPMIVRELVDIIHSSYLRALNGGERESLREARQVSQTLNPMGAGININNGMARQERGLLNPLRWISGKYK